VAGGAGGGGEYSVQLGFGWTNGAVLDLLHQYGADIQSRDDSDGDASATVSFFDYVALFVLLFTMFVR
jgi:alpha,alpha-trehalase